MKQIHKVQSTISLTLTALGFLLTTAVHAQEANVRFRINSVQSESGKRIFHFDGTTLRAVDNARVHLEVGDEIFPHARFEFSAVHQPGTSGREFDGSFRFRTGDGELLLSGTFDDALLFPRIRHERDSAHFFRRDDLGDGTFHFTIGPALASLPGCIAPEHFRLALWGLRFESSGENVATAENGSMFQNFTAKGSFFGRAALIPEPSALVLAAIGLAATLRGRKRLPTLSISGLSSIV